MQKIYLTAWLCVWAALACLAQEGRSAQQEGALTRPLALTIAPSAQTRTLFKQRNKEIQKLVKQYRKACAAEKPAIKEQLSQLVSAATDESMAWARQRIADEKANLQRWEEKLDKQEQQLSDIKARRVEELLSGEAKRRYKLAQKRWKKEIKAVKKSMR